MKTDWKERKPEIILLSVSFAAILLAVVFVVVYMNLSAPAPTVSSTETDADATEPPSEGSREPEDSIVITSGKPAPDGVPEIIVRFFAYLDAGEYENLANLMCDPYIILQRLENEESTEVSSNILNYKKARLLEVNLLGKDTYWGTTTWECFVDVETYRAGDVAANGINRYEIDITYFDQIDRWWRDDTYGEYEYIEHTTPLLLDGDELVIHWVEHGAEVSAVTVVNPSGKHEVSVMKYGNTDAVLFIDNEYFITCDYRTGEIGSTIGPNSVSGSSDGEWHTEFSDGIEDFFSLTIMSHIAPAPEKGDGISRLYSLFAFAKGDMWDKDVSVAELSPDVEYYIRSAGDLRIFWAERNGRIIYVDTVENVFSDYFICFSDYLGKAIRTAQMTGTDGTVQIDRVEAAPLHYYFYFADLYTGEVRDPLSGIDNDPDLLLRGSYIFNSDMSAAILGGGIRLYENLSYYAAFYVDLLTGEYFNIGNIEGIKLPSAGSDISRIYAAAFTDDKNVIIVSVYKQSHNSYTKVQSFEYDLKKKTLTPTDVYANLEILYYQ